LFFIDCSSQSGHLFPPIPSNLSGKITDYFFKSSMKNNVLHILFSTPKPEVKEEIKEEANLEGNEDVRLEEVKEEAKEEGKQLERQQIESISHLTQDVKDLLIPYANKYPIYLMINIGTNLIIQSIIFTDNPQHALQQIQSKIDQIGEERKLDNECSTKFQLNNNEPYSLVCETKRTITNTIFTSFRDFFLETLKENLSIHHDYFLVFDDLRLQFLKDRSYSIRLTSLNIPGKENMIFSFDGSSIMCMSTISHEQTKSNKYILKNDVDFGTNEIDLLKNLYHPNLVKLEGIIKGRIVNNEFRLDSNGTSMLLLKYCIGGDLFSKIENQKKNAQKNPSTNTQPLALKDRKLTFKGMVKIMYHAAKALCYLHNHAQLVHKDIKTNNIFLKEDPKNPNDVIGVIGDLGLASQLQQGPNMRSSVGSRIATKHGVSLFKDPRCHEKSKFRRCYDIYAFGVVLYHIFVWKIWTSEPWLPSHNDIINMRNHYMDAMDSIRDELKSEYGADLDTEIIEEISFRLVDLIRYCVSTEVIENPPRIDPVRIDLEKILNLFPSHLPNLI
jgi:serine/threonine protein kinase